LTLEVIISYLQVYTIYKQKQSIEIHMHNNKIDTFTHTVLRVLDQTQKTKTTLIREAQKMASPGGLRLIVITVKTNAGHEGILNV